LLGFSIQFFWPATSTGPGQIGADSISCEYVMGLISVYTENRLSLFYYRLLPSGTSDLDCVGWTIKR